MKTNEEDVWKDKYTEDLEHDIDMLATMVLDLRKENEELKETVREIGGKDLYKYLYHSEDPNQLELFDE